MQLIIKISLNLKIFVGNNIEVLSLKAFKNDNRNGKTFKDNALIKAGCIKINIIVTQQ